MKKTLPLLILAALVVGCGQNGQSGQYVPQEPKQPQAVEVAAGQEATLFPLQVGNRWRYRMDSVTMIGSERKKDSEEITMEVKSVEDLPDGGKRAVVEMSKNDDVVTDRQVWEVTKEGIAQISIGIDTKSTYSPPQFALKFPIEKDKEWEYKGTGPTPLGKVGSIVSKGKVTGPTNVDTENQSLSAYQCDVSSTYSVDNGATARDEVQMFWSPNVGLVRYRQTLLAIAKAKDAGGASQDVGIGNQVVMTLIEKKP